MTQTAKTYDQQLAEAHCLANQMSLFVVVRSGEFILYRRTDGGNVRLGRRSTVRGLTRMIKQCGVPNDALNVGENNEY